MARKKKIIPKPEPIEKPEQPVQLTKKQRLWVWAKQNIPTYLAWYLRIKGLPL